jgi:hypothetical protein
MDLKLHRLEKGHRFLVEILFILKKMMIFGGKQDILTANFFFLKKKARTFV